MGSAEPPTITQRRLTVSCTEGWRIWMSANRPKPSGGDFPVCTLREASSCFLLPHPPNPPRSLRGKITLIIQAKTEDRAGRAGPDGIKI